jgi:hypothetical protein
MNRRTIKKLNLIEAQVDALLTRGVKGMSQEQLREAHATLIGHVDTVAAILREEFYVLPSTRHVNIVSKGTKNEAQD